MSGQLVILTSEAFELGVVGTCISFFEQNEIRIRNLYDQDLDESRAVTLRGRGMNVSAGRIVLIELKAKVSEDLREQFNVYSRGAGIVIAPEDEELLNNLFLF